MTESNTEHHRRSGFTNAVSNGTMGVSRSQGGSLDAALRAASFLSKFRVAVYESC